MIDDQVFSKESKTKGIGVKDAVLKVLSAGAAESLLRWNSIRLVRDLSVELDISFAPVGANRDALLAGAECDVHISSVEVTNSLIQAGVLESRFEGLGTVATGIAIQSGRTIPDIGDEQAFAKVLKGCTRVHCIDPISATGGRHFAAVLARLGLKESLAGRLQVAPNGSAAMRELASSTDVNPVGCAQVTEIIGTEGVKVAGPLPGDLGLNTEYVVSIAKCTRQRVRALEFLELITGVSYYTPRRDAGFTNRC